MRALMEPIGLAFRIDGDSYCGIGGLGLQNDRKHMVWVAAHVDEWDQY
jgi:hypothetical protein